MAIAWIILAVAVAAFAIASSVKAEVVFNGERSGELMLREMPAAYRGGSHDRAGTYIVEPPFAGSLQRLHVGEYVYVVHVGGFSIILERDVILAARSIQTEPIYE